MIFWWLWKILCHILYKLIHYLQNTVTSNWYWYSYQNIFAFPKICFAATDVVELVFVIQLILTVSSIRPHHLMNQPLHRSFERNQSMHFQSAKTCECVSNGCLINNNRIFLFQRNERTNRKYFKYTCQKDRKMSVKKEKVEKEGLRIRLSSVFEGKSSKLWPSPWETFNDAKYSSPRFNKLRCTSVNRPSFSSGNLQTNWNSLYPLTVLILIEMKGS